MKKKIMSVSEAIQVAVDGAVEDAASNASGGAASDANGVFASATTKALWFPEPCVDDVRVQLFGIMLGEQLNAMSHAMRKHKKSHREKASAVAYVPPDYQETSCFDVHLLRRDPILKLALLHEDFDDPSAFAREVYEYAKRTSDKMPMYMHKAYEEFTKSSEIVLHLAGVYFFVSWHTDFHGDTGEIYLRQMPDIFEHIGFRENTDALQDVHFLVEKFEKGKMNMTSMIDFVNKLVNNRWKKVAQPYTREN